MYLLCLLYETKFSHLLLSTQTLYVYLRTRGECINGYGDDKRDETSLIVQQEVNVNGYNEDKKKNEVSGSRCCDGEKVQKQFSITEVIDYSKLGEGKPLDEIKRYFLLNNFY